MVFIKCFTLGVFLLLHCFPLNGVARKELWCCVPGSLGGSPALSMGWMPTAEGKGCRGDTVLRPL